MADTGKEEEAERGLDTATEGATIMDTEKPKKPSDVSVMKDGTDNSVKEVLTGKEEKDNDGDDVLMIDVVEDTEVKHDQDTPTASNTKADDVSKDVEGNIQGKSVTFFTSENQSELFELLTKEKMFLSRSVMTQDMITEFGKKLIIIYPLSMDDLTNGSLVPHLDKTGYFDVTFKVDIDQDGKAMHQGACMLFIRKSSDFPQTLSDLQSAKSGLVVTSGEKYFQDTKTFVSFTKRFSATDELSDVTKTSILSYIQIMRRTPPFPHHLTLFSNNIPQDTSEEQLWELFPKARYIAFACERQHLYVAFDEEATLQKSIETLRCQTLSLPTLHLCRLDDALLCNAANFKQAHIKKKQGKKPKTPKSVTPPKHVKNPVELPEGMVRLSKAARRRFLKKQWKLAEKGNDPANDSSQPLPSQTDHANHDNGAVAVKGPGAVEAQSLKVAKPKQNPPNTQPPGPSEATPGQAGQDPPLSKAARRRRRLRQMKAEAAGLEVKVQPESETISKIDPPAQSPNDEQPPPLSKNAAKRRAQKLKKKMLKDMNNETPPPNMAQSPSPKGKKRKFNPTEPNWKGNFKRQAQAWNQNRFQQQSGFKMPAQQDPDLSEGLNLLQTLSTIARSLSNKPRTFSRQDFNSFDQGPPPPLGPQPWGSPQQKKKQKKNSWQRGPGNRAPTFTQPPDYSSPSTYPGSYTESWHEDIVDVPQQNFGASDQLWNNKPITSFSTPAPSGESTQNINSALMRLSADSSMDDSLGQSKALQQNTFSTSYGGSSYDHSQSDYTF